MPSFLFITVAYAVPHSLSLTFSCIFFFVLEKRMLKNMCCFSIIQLIYFVYHRNTREVNAHIFETLIVNQHKKNEHLNISFQPKSMPFNYRKKLEF